MNTDTAANINTEDLNRAFGDLKQDITAEFEVDVNNAIVFKRLRDQAKTAARRAYYDKKLRKINQTHMKTLVRMAALDKQLQKLQQQEKETSDPISEDFPSTSS